MFELRPPPRTERDWLAVTDQPIPVAEALAFAADARCGAVVLFCGTVRDHAPGRAGVSALEYEAYTEQVEPRLVAIAADARARFPGVGRLVAIHRTGRLAVGDVAVVVVASTEHRHDGFDAARFVIDTIKTTLPIWKLETWEGGSAWSDACEPVQAVGPSPAHPAHPAR